MSVGKISNIISECLIESIWTQGQFKHKCNKVSNFIIWKMKWLKFSQKVRFSSRIRDIVNCLSKCFKQDNGEPIFLVSQKNRTGAVNDSIHCRYVFVSDPYVSFNNHIEEVSHQS